MGVNINIGDSWKAVNAIKINIGDAWKDVIAGWVNISDVWKSLNVPEFSMTWTSIANATTFIGGDATTVAAWNTFFDLPTNGMTFTGIAISGEKVTLTGGGSLLIASLKFLGCSDLLIYQDTRGVTTSVDDGGFYGATGATSIEMTGFTSSVSGNGHFNRDFSCTSFKFPALTYVRNNFFYNCTSATYFDLSSCTSLGDDQYDDNVFKNIVGKTITLKIPSALMTNNGGNPDGDIQTLQANNTVTIIQV